MAVLLLTSYLGPQAESARATDRAVNKASHIMSIGGLYSQACRDQDFVLQGSALGRLYALGFELVDSGGHPADVRRVLARAIFGAPMRPDV